AEEAWRLGRERESGGGAREKEERDEEKRPPESGPRNEPDGTEERGQDSAQEEQSDENVSSGIARRVGSGRAKLPEDGENRSESERRGNDEERRQPPGRDSELQRLRMRVGRDGEVID